MVDFSNPLDAYLKKEGLANTPEERKKVEEELSDLVTLFRFDEDGGYRSNRTDSLFALEEGTMMSEADFEALISNATEGQYDKNDLELLYDILNSDQKDGLSYEELSILANKNGQITRSSMFFALNGEGSYDAVEEVKTGSTSDTDGSGSTTGTDTGVNPSGDGESNPEVDADGQVASTDQIPTEENFATVEVSDSVLNELRTLLYEIVVESDKDNLTNPASVIDFWKNNPNAITDILPEGADVDQVLDDLSSSYITYSDDDEATISAYMKLANCSRTEAIEAKKSELGDPITTADTPLREVESDVNKEPLSPEAIKLWQEDLKDAINSADYTKVNEILTNPDLTPQDFVNIVATYRNSAGSGLIEHVDDVLVGFQDVIAQKLVEAANSGVENAPEVIAQQIKSATTEQAGTANQYLTALFDQLKDNPELMQDVCEKFGGRESLIDVIESEHSRFWEGKESYELGQSYIEIINGVYRNIRE